MKIRDCLERLCGIPVPLTDPPILRTREEFETCRWIEEVRTKPTWEELEAVWPEVESELEHANTIDEISETDTSFIRFSEDLANALIAKGVLSLEDLPGAAVDKLEARAALRAKLAE